ncbi:hypothetical protein G4B88_006409 [Cannabis sativa]|uniref:Formiminotransferase N-terminal subdomain domain-containing protein n=1 Tax=Cannabis sativa TaxID=3483 RepID=A0A7J6H454_CANSA|nr:hypothetical protein G4B88_006409 [Cannabis sativa]
MLGCCKVYISESRNRAALESIERAAKLFPKAPIINKFVDETYNRVGYTLVSKLVPCPLRTSVLAMVKAALESIDLELHSGSHPLVSTSLDQAANIAKSLAAHVGYGLQGVIVIGATRWVDNYNVPVFCTDLLAIRRIAKGVSGRGGGLPWVQAMALALGETVIEVACNLLDPNIVGGDRVQLESYLKLDLA